MKIHHSPAGFTATTAVLLLLGSCGAFAQSEKRPLDTDAYDIWNSIGEKALSDDGQWVLYTQGPEDGDTALHVRHLQSDRAYLVPQAKAAAFEDNARHVVFMIKPQKAAVRQAKLAEKKKDELPRDALGILDLDSGNITRVEEVKSFRLPKKASGYVAYLLEKPAADKKDKTRDTEAEELKEEQEEEEKAEKEPKKKKDKKAEGTPLVLRNLATGAETRFADVLEYQLTEDGQWLAYTASNKDGTADGIFAVETATGNSTALMTGKGVYKQAAFDEAGRQFAFLSNRNDMEADQPAFTLYYWRIGTAAPEALATAGTPGIPAGWWIGEHGALQFSKQGRRLLFGTAPRPAPEPEATVPDDEKVVLDVWNWRDPLLQPMQLKQLEREKNRTYRAIVHLTDRQSTARRIVQLADEDVPEVEIGAEGEAQTAIGHGNLPYQQRISWDSPGYNDVYLIDVDSGERRLVLQELQSQATLSPQARYITWWNGSKRSWYAMSTRRDASGPLNLGAGIPHPLHDELNDRPQIPAPYGTAGWTEDDALFLVYDKYDLWALDPGARRAPRNVTEGVGRDANIRLRHLRLDPEEKFIDPDKPLLLSAFNLTGMSSGFYRDRIRGDGKPRRLLMMDRSFSSPQQAEDATTLLYTRESFNEFPDVWVSTPEFTNPRRISTANPQQQDYSWGSAELVHWTALDGEPLSGILYKPEGFNAAQKYPMMVYFYERMSERLHSHNAPVPNRSRISISFYVSRGYLVFIPDIPYRIGYPGESAVNAVLPGVGALIEQGFVDRSRIGVQGHSWGGYQIAYLVTETNMFAAAESGAPVSNMISAYGGIRWGSGMSRMFQYEKTQSRIGGTLWEYPLRYIENSPIFNADKIETPLLILHNDQDGAVPWYQGIELFVAGRRLGKPTWMLNYNGEDHGIAKYQNKRDFAIRMQQFFDHYLMDAPMPVWMKSGVPAVDKGRTLGLEPAAD